MTAATTGWIFRAGRGDVADRGTLCSFLSFWGLQVFRQVLLNTRHGDGLQAVEHFHYVTIHSSSSLSQFSPAVCCSHGAASVRENTPRLVHNYDT